MQEQRDEEGVLSRPSVPESPNGLGMKDLCRPTSSLQRAAGLRPAAAEFEERWPDSGGGEVR